VLRALILRKAALLRTAVAVCQATAHVLHATPPVVEHKRPNQAPRTDYKSSVWWRALQHPNVSNPTTKEGRKFRLRFRVPFPIFQRLLALSREWFPQRDTDVSGRPSVPIELKLLCVLRVLGRGVCFDDCEEITGADEETLRSTATIAAAERLYAALGLPGAISSTDCTHAQWDICHAFKSFLWQKSEFPAAVLMDALLCCTAELVAHKGPKGKPTRVFQMTVGHNH